MSSKNDLIVYGRHPVVDLIQSGKPVDKLLLQQGIRGEFEKEIRHLCKAYEIPFKVVPKDRLSKFSSGNHQGVIALLSPIPYYKIEDVLPMVYEQSKVPLFLLLDEVTDVRNFGSIARTAEVSGADAIIIPSKGAARINADAIKTSAGALTKIPVCRCSSLMGAIEYLQLSGIQVLASSLKSDKMVYELDLQLPTAFIIGSEGEGVSRPLLRKSDQQFIIPQLGETDSYNVAVASGIMLYETVRQRSLPLSNLGGD